MVRKDRASTRGPGWLPCHRLSGDGQAVPRSRGCESLRSIGCVSGPPGRMVRVGADARASERPEQPGTSVSGFGRIRRAIPERSSAQPLRPSLPQGKVVPAAGKEGVNMGAIPNPLRGTKGVSRPVVSPPGLFVRRRRVCIIGELLSSPERRWLGQCRSPGRMWCMWIGFLIARGRTRGSVLPSRPERVGPHPGVRTIPAMLPPEYTAYNARSPGKQLPLARVAAANADSGVRPPLTRWAWGQPQVYYGRIFSAGTFTRLLPRLI